MLNYKFLFFFILLCFIGMGYSQVAPSHSRLIVSHDLKSDSNLGPITMFHADGEFSTDGWVTRSHTSQMKILFDDFLPHEGTVEVKMKGFDWNAIVSSMSAQWDWTPIGLWSNGSCSFYDLDKNGGSYFFLKSDFGVYDTYGGAFKAFSAPFFGDKNRSNKYPIPDAFHNWDANKWYTFKIVWGKPENPAFGDNRYIWLLINGQQVYAKEFDGQIETFAYLSLGKDNAYEGAPGITYADLRVYTSDTDYPFTNSSFSTGTTMNKDLGSQGVTLPDVNGDGIEDILVSKFYDTKSNYPKTLLVSDGAGGWIDQSQGSGLFDDAWSFGSISADFDQDGDHDVFSIHYNQPDKLYFNDGTGSFTDVSSARGISGESTDSKAATLIDVENDGDIDILVVNKKSAHKLYINDGQGFFTSESRGVTSITDANGMVNVVVGDLSGDGVQDIILLCDGGQSRFLLNNGSGNFSDRSATSGFDLTVPATSASLADIDNDADLDIIVAETKTVEQTDDTRLHFFLNNGSGNFTNVTAAKNITLNTFGVQFADFNNDGDLDMLGHVRHGAYISSQQEDAYANTHLTRFFENDGSGNFTQVRFTQAELTTTESRAISLLDYDDDGFIDFYTPSRGSIVYHDGAEKPVGRSYLMHNDGADRYPNNNFLKVKIENDAEALAGLGAKIWVYSTGQLDNPAALLGYREVIATNGYLGQSSWTQHIGIGTNFSMDIKVQLPGGSIRTYSSFPANQTLVIGASQVIPYQIERVVQEPIIDAVAGESYPVQYKVTSVDDEPAAGVSVEFTVTAGGGSINNNSSAILLTGSDGIVSVPWILGPVSEIENALRMSAVFNGVDLLGSPDEVRVIPGVASAAELLLISGNNQVGVVNTELSDSLIVQVNDVHGNPVENHDVVFTVTSGGGLFKKDAQSGALLSVQTNAAGQAHVMWMMGAVLGAQQATVTAEFLGNPLTNSPILLTATAEAPKRVLSIISGNVQRASVFTQLASPFRVKLVDANGIPVNQEAIEFLSVEGDGKFSGQDTFIAQTNSIGEATANFTTGSLVGDSVYVIHAKAQDALGSPAIFYVSGQAGPPVDLQAVSVTNFEEIAGRKLADPFTVQLFDEHQNPVANHKVFFAASVGGGTFENGASVDTVLTNEFGFASTFFRAGKTVGSNTVIATAAGLSSVPVYFYVNGVVGPPARLNYVRGNRQTGQRNKRLPLPFVVSVTDSNFNKIDNYQVAFEVTSGGGNIDGAQTFQTTTTFGQAGAFLTLGADDFLNTVQARAFYNSYQLIGSPVEFEAFSGPGDPSKLAYVSGNNQKGRVNTRLPMPFRVRVEDAYEQGVANVIVDFIRIQGGGVFMSGEETFSTRTDENGVAEAYAVLGDGKGNNNNLFEANCSVDGKRLGGSPIQFVASGRTSLATHMHKVNGQEPFTAVVGTILNDSLRVMVTDSLGQPIADHPVNFDIQGSGLLNEQYYALKVNSNLQGIAAVGVTVGSRPGRLTITAASDDGVDPLSPASLEFYVDVVPGTPNAEKTSITANTNVVANGQDSSLVTVVLHDKFDNPISGKQVTLATSQLDVFIGQITQPTDENGRVEGYLQSSKVLQTKVWAMVDGQPLVETVVDFVPGAPAYALQFPETIRAEKGKAVENVGLVVKDQWSHVVPGVDVVFKVTAGGGSVSTNEPVTTDENGSASVTWTLGDVIGANQQRMVAMVQGLQDSVRFYGTAIPPQQGEMTIVSGNQQSGLVNQLFTQALTVLVTDDNDVPISDIPVSFLLYAPIGEGQATFIGDPIKYTNAEGIASIQFKAGTRLGMHSIKADAGIYGQVTFSLMVQQTRTVYIHKVSEDGLVTRPLYELPVQFKITDAFDNVMPYEPVTFEVTAGNGSVVEGLPVVSNEEGIVSVTWRLGNLSGEQRLKVVPSNALPAEDVYFVAMVQNAAPYFNPPIPSTLSVVAGDTLKIAYLRAIDPEGDGYFFTMDYQPLYSKFFPNGEPAFIWEPKNEQAGTDSLVFRVTDDFGASMTTKVVVTVSIRNKQPVIAGKVPANSNLVLKYNQEQEFIVYAEDDDELTYKWEVNNLYSGNKSSLALFISELIFPNQENNIVKCTISDGYTEPVVVQWTLSMTTAVELSSFAAQSEGNEVTLNWSTSKEEYTSGFFVMRSHSSDGPFKAVNEDIIEPKPQGEYQFVDTDVQAGRKYFYSLREQDKSGNMTDHGLLEVEIALPEKLSLAQNYPNPFNPTTTIKFELPETQNINLTIFNTTGQVVKTLIDGQYAAGVHKVVWDATNDMAVNVPSGIYYYRMKTEEKVLTKKLVLLK